MNYKLIIFFALIATIALSGCGFLRPHSDQQGAVVVLFDRSDSTRKQREFMQRDLDSFEKSAAESHYTFELWAYDRAPIHLYGPEVPLGEDVTAPIESKQIEVYHDSPLRGSAMPSAMFVALANDAALAKFPIVRIIVITSIDSTFHDASEINSATSALSKRPGYRVAVLGVGPKNSALWDKALRSQFQNRLDLVTPDQAEAMLRQNRDE